MHCCIEIRQVRKQLSPFTLTIDSFDIEDGEILSIVGPSGSGKSTLLELIAGFQKPESGTISVLGRSPSNHLGRQRKIRILFQESYVFPTFSVFDQLCLAHSLAQADGITPRWRRLLPRRRRWPRSASLAAREWIERLHLIDRAHAFPSALSGGELKRLALGRALIAKPRVLLLDEPFSGIDPQRKYELESLLASLHRSLGITFVLVTHDPALALSIASRVGVLSEGRILQVGSPLDVYHKPVSEEVAEALGPINVVPTQSGSLLIRPESVNLMRREAHHAASLQGRILRRTFHGMFEQCELETEHGELIIRKAKPIVFDVGECVTITW